jgi:putative transposase
VNQPLRDDVVQFIDHWSQRSELSLGELLRWIGITKSKYYSWQQRLGHANQHNALVPRDGWLTQDEQDRICQFARANPLAGYRRLCYMMLDADVVACSPSSVYRVLKRAGLLNYPSPQPSKKGTGFEQPLQPHEHWHIDICHIKIQDQYYFLCSILDGCSRYLIEWEVSAEMPGKHVQIIIQKARERFPNARPRIISDNGPQFIANEFKHFVLDADMTHVRTSPYYPQSNGKMERYHRTMKDGSLRPKVPLSLDEAIDILTDYVEYYNAIRLHSAIRYVTPLAKLEGRDQQIHAERAAKLALAKQRRLEQHAHAPRAKAKANQPIRIDFARLRTELKIVEVLGLLGFRELSRSGAQVRGACPLHRSKRQTKQCFSANVEQHLFQCFVCQRSGNAFDLWVLSCGLPVYEAAVLLCERLKRPLPTTSQDAG